MRWPLAKRAVIGRGIFIAIPKLSSVMLSHGRAIGVIVEARPAPESPATICCPQCATPKEGAPVPTKDFPYVTALAHCLACGHEWSIMRLLEP
jgi:hypothetical protein